MHLTGNNRQRGFGATAALFMIALVVGIGSALVYANRDTSGNAKIEAERALVGVLMRQASDLRSAANRYLFANGQASLEGMTWDDNAATGLFAPAKQYAVIQKAPGTLVKLGTAEWHYNSAMVIPGVATTAADQIAFVSDLTDSACAAANSSAHGSSYATINSIPTAGKAWVAFHLSPEAITPDVNGWDIGCVRTTDSRNVFYVVLHSA